MLVTPNFLAKRVSQSHAAVNPCCGLKMPEQEASHVHPDILGDGNDLTWIVGPLLLVLGCRVSLGLARSVGV